MTQEAGKNIFEGKTFLSEEEGKGAINNYIETLKGVWKLTSHSLKQNAYVWECKCDRLCKKRIRFGWIKYHNAWIVRICKTHAEEKKKQNEPLQIERPGSRETWSIIKVENQRQSQTGFYRENKESNHSEEEENKLQGINIHTCLY